jgi:hypothetical protein
MFETFIGLICYPHGAGVFLVMNENDALYMLSCNEWLDGRPSLKEA